MDLNILLNLNQASTTTTIAISEVAMEKAKPKTIKRKEKRRKLSNQAN